jgi:hypothetical protein
VESLVFGFMWCTILPPTPHDTKITLPIPPPTPTHTHTPQPHNTKHPPPTPTATTTPPTTHPTHHTHLRNPHAGADACIDKGAKGLVQERKRLGGPLIKLIQRHRRLLLVPAGEAVRVRLRALRCQRRSAAAVAAAVAAIFRAWGWGEGGVSCMLFVCVCHGW